MWAGGLFYLLWIHLFIGSIYPLRPCYADPAVQVNTNSADDTIVIAANNKYTKNNNVI